MLMKRFCERGKLLSSLFCSSCKGVDGRDLAFVLGAVTGVVSVTVVVVTVTVVSGAIAIAVAVAVAVAVVTSVSAAAAATFTGVACCGTCACSPGLAHGVCSFFRFLKALLVVPAVLSSLMDAVFLEMLVTVPVSPVLLSVPFVLRTTLSPTE